MPVPGMPLQAPTDVLQRDPRIEALIAGQLKKPTQPSANPIDDKKAQAREQVNKMMAQEPKPNVMKDAQAFVQSFPEKPRDGLGKAMDMVMRLNPSLAILPAAVDATKGLINTVDQTKGYIDTAMEYGVNSPEARSREDAILELGLGWSGASTARSAVVGGMTRDPLVASAGGDKPPVRLSPDHMQIEQGLSDRLNAINKKIQDRDFTRPELKSLIDEKKDVSDKLSQMVKLRNSLLRPKQTMLNDEGIPPVDKIDGPVVQPKSLTLQLNKNAFNAAFNPTGKMEVLVNPSRFEMNKLLQDVGSKIQPGTTTQLRYLRNENGDFYVWDAATAIHHEVNDMLNKQHPGQHILYDPSKDGGFIVFDSNGKPFIDGKPMRSYMKTDEGIPKTEKIDGPVVKQREVIDYDLRKLTDDTYDYTDHSAPTGQMIKNPTKADLAKLSVIPPEKRIPGGGSKTAIRVIEDADGNVYAWNGWGAIHYELEQYLKTVTDGKFKSARDYYVEFGADGKPYYYNEPDVGYTVEDYGKPYKMNPSQQQQSNAGGPKDAIGVEAPKGITNPVKTHSIETPRKPANDNMTEDDIQAKADWDAHQAAVNAEQKPFVDNFVNTLYSGDKFSKNRMKNAKIEPIDLMPIIDAAESIDFKELKRLHEIYSLGKSERASIFAKFTKDTGRAMAQVWLRMGGHTKEEIALMRSFLDD